MKWYEIQGNGHDVVISSRVRLARNLEDFPFTPKLDAATSEAIAQKTVGGLAWSASEKNWWFTICVLPKQENACCWRIIWSRPIFARKRP